MNNRESGGGGDMRTYSFDMVALSEHLRRQTDQNRTGSYFNIDIIKYQASANI